MMIRFLILLLIFFPQINFTQVDQIILPELDLVLEDQSSLNTYSTESAIIKERTPQFQEVYLEELRSGIEDSFINSEISSKNTFRSSYLEFAYGSFNNTQINAFSQNYYKNLFYKLSYQGQYRGNSKYNAIENQNTSLYNNTMNINLLLDLTNTTLDMTLDYQQNKISLHNLVNNNQYNHYIPLNFKVKHWVNDFSYIDILASTGFSILSYQNLQGQQTKENLLIDGILNMTYKVNLVEWNYIEAQIAYYINDYSISQAHTGLLKLKSNFLLGKGFSIDAGFALVGSSIDTIFGWPEVGFSYSYLNYFSLYLKVTGDFNLYNAYQSSQEYQFYSLTPAPESRWIYAGAIKITPSPFFWLLTEIAYNDYRHKRIYSYNETTSLYYFDSTAHVGLLASKVEIGAEVLKIFDIAISYTYQQIQQTWLLMAPHKFDILMNLGYTPFGFNFETRYTLYASRNLTPLSKGAVIHLLNMKISQKIYHIAEIFIEVNNILNQQIQFTSETYYGGIQANGGIKLNF